MKPLMPSPSKPRTTLPIPANLNSLLTIIWTFFLIAPNVTSDIIPPSCASTCYLSAFDTQASECDALNTSCLCTILESTDYLTCIEDDCDTASLQLASEYGAEYCGAGYSSLVGGAAAASTTAPSTAVTSIAPTININPGEATTIVPTDATSTSSSAAAFAAATNTFDTFSIPTSTTALFPTLTPTPTPTPTTIIIQQNPDDSYGSNNHGLSAHAKAGIGAGAGVGGSALLAVVGVLAWKLGQRNKKREEEEKIAKGRAMGAAAAAGGAAGDGNNDNGGGVVSGGVNYVPKASGGEEEAAWTKIEATATESELDGGNGHEHEEGGEHGHVQETML